MVVESKDGGFCFAGFSESQDYDISIPRKVMIFGGKIGE